MKSDEELLKEWQAARGRSAPVLSPHQVPQIMKALRSRQDVIENRKPLEFCAVCQVKARGPHNPK